MSPPEVLLTETNRSAASLFNLRALVMDRRGRHDFFSNTAVLRYSEENVKVRDRLHAVAQAAAEPTKQVVRVRPWQRDFNYVKDRIVNYEDATRPR